jgi:hypothetical protein
MPNINLDCDYFDHPKTRRLIGLLGRGAAELPIRLWTYCGKFHAESGSLTGHSAQEIESIVGWWGKSGEMVEAMVKVGFLDRSDDGVFIIHDFKSTQGHISVLKERAKIAAEARWEKMRSNATSIAQASSKQSPIPSLTSPDQTKTKNNNPPLPPPGDWWLAEIPDDLRGNEAEIRDWMAYKREKGQKYKPTGIKAFWRALRAIPPEKRRESVDWSMANNWSGLFQKRENTGSFARKVTGEAGHVSGKYDHVSR